MHCFSSIFTQCSSSLEMRYWCARMSDQTILSIVFSCNASLALKLRLWLGTAASGLVVTWIVWYSRWYPTMQEDLHQLVITAAVGLHFWGICCYAWLRSCIHKILFGVLKQTPISASWFCLAYDMYQGWPDSHIRRVIRMHHFLRIPLNKGTWQFLISFVVAGCHKLSSCSDWPFHLYILH